MSHQELLVEAVQLSEILVENLQEAESANQTLLEKNASLKADKLALDKKAQELQDELDGQVQLVKVAGADQIPMDKIASVANTLVDQGFLPEENKETFQQALREQGATALLNTLHKVASSAIKPVSFKDEGSLVMDKAAAAAESNEELLDDNQKIWAESFDIKVAK